MKTATITLEQAKEYYNKLIGREYGIQETLRDFLETLFTRDELEGKSELTKKWDSLPDKWCTKYDDVFGKELVIDFINENSKSIYGKIDKTKIQYPIMGIDGDRTIYQNSIHGALLEIPFIPFWKVVDIIYRMKDIGQELTKKRDYKEFKIDMTVAFPNNLSPTEDSLLDMFVHWIETRGGSCGGGISEYTEEDYKALDNEQELTKKFEELEVKEGYLITNHGEVKVCDLFYNNPNMQRNIFATESQAKSALAFAMLSQIAKECNDRVNWKPNWEHDKQLKWNIIREGDRLTITASHWLFHHITFFSKAAAEESLEKHNQLWKEYWELS